MSRLVRVVSLALCIAPLVTSAGPSGLAHASAGKSLATVSVLAAPVMVGGRSGSAPASDGQLLELGDEVWTGSEGLALLTFLDGSETQLQGNTQIVLESPAGSQPGSGVSVFLSAGTAVTHVQHLAPNARFQTDTPSAVAMVRGTTYVVSVETVEPAAGEIFDQPAAFPTADEETPTSDQPAGEATPAEPSADDADWQQAAAVGGAPLALAVDRPNGCRREDPAGCATSVVLLADADGHVGHVEVASHVHNRPNLHLTTHGDAAHVSREGVKRQTLESSHIAHLQEAAHHLRDVQRAMKAHAAAQHVLRAGLPAHVPAQTRH